MHWADEYYDFLTNVKQLEILEKRYDDPATRGEFMKMIALALGYRKE